MNFNYFLIFSVLYIGTIVFIQVTTRLWPRHAPRIGNFQPHHYLLGLILIAIYLITEKFHIFLPIGLAIVVDEIPLFFIFKGWNWPDNHWKEYHSKQSIIGIILISILVYLILFLTHGQI